MPLDLIDDKSTLIQVMALCRQEQAITWASVDQDLCRHMVSLGHSELMGSQMAEGKFPLRVARCTSCFKNQSF